MTKEMIIEMIGYLGSLLVLVSFIMTSVFKLRIVNSIGSLIFMIYALIIRSYPTAIMNFCLVLINVRFLWKMMHDRKQFELVKAEVDDSFVQYFLDKYHDDICKFFPDQDFAFPKDAKAYLVTHEGRPVGLTIGKQEKDRLELLLDYSIEAYRDFSIGTFLFEQLAKEDIRTITYAGPDEQHQEYLQKMGFVKEDGVYIKTL
ncbi:MAG: YgjV family protein [Erysipelotrichaceae bacterium]|nr:YgjV family protein [Erysipelotrichaceae bacterium]